jgi:hypothetical protein
MTLKHDIPPHTVLLASINPKTQPIKFVVFQKIRFTLIPGTEHYFISDKPVALTSLASPNLSAITDLIFKIENESRKQYLANLINVESITRLKLDRIVDLSRKNIILLGLKEGQLGMISMEGGVSSYHPLSTGSLEKFKGDIFFHILLKKQESNE